LGDRDSDRRARGNSARPCCRAPAPDSGTASNGQGHLGVGGQPAPFSRQHGVPQGDTSTQVRSTGAATPVIPDGRAQLLRCRASGAGQELPAIRQQRRLTSPHKAPRRPSAIDVLSSADIGERMGACWDESGWLVNGMQGVRGSDPLSSTQVKGPLRCRPAANPGRRAADTQQPPVRGQCVSPGRQSQAPPSRGSSPGRRGPSGCRRRRGRGGRPRGPLKRFARSGDVSSGVLAAWGHATNRLPPQPPRSA
jgi:hypothetical protein